MEPIQIQNVRPIHNFSFLVRDGGGVTVLRGRQESGKSKTLEAVSALLGADHNLEPDPSVLAPSVVQGFGVTLRLSSRSKRPQGELEVDRLEGIDPYDLVDPGIDDPARADAARLVTLCRMAGAVPKIADFQKALGVDIEKIMGEKTRALLSATLPEFTASLRRDLHKMAQSSEDLASAHRSRAAGLREGAGLEAPDSEGLAPAEWSRRAGVAAGRRVEMARALADQAVREQQADKAKSALEVLRSQRTEDLGALMADIQRIHKLGEETRNQIVVLGRALADARAQEDQFLREHSAAVDRHRKASDRMGDIAVLEGDLAAVADTTSSKDLAVQIEEIAHEQAAIEVGYKASILNEKRSMQLNKADEEAEAARMYEVEAEAARQRARECERVLSDAIAKLTPRGLFAREGRLIVERDGGECHYHDLSHGARSTLAVLIACDGLRSTGKPPVLVIRQEAWEGLDPEHQDECDRLARELGVNILTAEAASGEIRAEHYEPQGGATAPR